MITVDAKASKNIVGTKGDGNVEPDEDNLAAGAWGADPWPDFDALEGNHFGTVAQQGDKAARSAKRLTHRYSIITESYGANGDSGMGELWGNDFLVTLGTWPGGGTADEKRGTFMHELGHTLRLGHGGDSHTQYKPNYHSVMNYLWQVPHPGQGGGH